jgi:hypothetical protein
VAKLLVPRGAVDEPPHIARLKSVARWRQPEEDSQEWFDFRLRSAAAMADPRYRKKLKDLAREAWATAQAVSKNGAGLPADAGVREFLDEYNRRTARHGLHYLPSSFNIYEAFCSYVPRLAVFVPLEERDHICSIAGFLDFITSSPPSIPPHYDVDIPDGVIHSYSFLESVGEWAFENDGTKFTLTSASLVKHDSEITMMCLVGREANLSTENERLKELGDLEPAPHRSDLEQDPDRKLEAVALDTNERFWREYVAFRYDLRQGRLQTRYTMADAGSIWYIKSDDPLTLEASVEIGGDAEAQITAINADQGVFSFLAQIMRLPEYFRHRASSIVKDKAITSISELASTSKGRKQLDGALKPQVRYEREVLTVQDSGTEIAGFMLPAFELKVEIEGFWERLPFGTYGEGPDGERVLGRTWVRRTLAKRESKMPGAVTKVDKSAPALIGGAEEGSIYVLRNAAHQLDMFKIGLTRRSVGVRASELSRGTGVPDQFLVVQTWWVPDVIYAERRVHQILDAYRLKDAREFFRADYTTIRAAIDMVVAELAGRATPR